MSLVSSVSQQLHNTIANKTTFTQKKFSDSYTHLEQFPTIQYNNRLHNTERMKINLRCIYIYIF